MQIFYLDEDPYMAAHDLCDKHVCKMIVESTQILSTSVHILLQDDDIEIKGLYKMTHSNHPCMRWARKSFENFDWLYKHLDGLLHEYGSRYGKVHKTTTVFIALKSYRNFLSKNKSKLFKEKEFTEPLCIEDPSCIIGGDSVESYRLYYRKYKLRFAKWKSGKIPEWIYE